MSCGRTENDDEENPALPSAITPSRVCIRCAKLATILVRVVEYCDDCFMDAFRTKYKRGLEVARNHSRYGSTEDIKKGLKKGSERSSVLLAFSGGMGSRALLDLMQIYCPRREAKSGIKGKYVPSTNFSSIEVVYVDESGVPGYGDVDRTEEIKGIVESLGFKFIGLKLEDVFATGGAPLIISNTSPALISDPTSSTSVSTALASLRSILAPHSTTSRTALHASLLQSLLRRTALARSHDILLTGETATRIAIKVLAGMAEGRGWGMGEEVGAAWESKGLLVCRPLVVCLVKEVAYYLRKQGLEVVLETKPSTGLEARVAGIEALTEEFVLRLEANFPSTVSTVVRTAAKLGMRTADANERHTNASPCPLCGLPAQVGASEWRQAITISALSESQYLSSSLPAPTAPLAADTIPLASLLCYGCLLVYQGLQQSTKPGQALLETESVLPPYVREAAVRAWSKREEGMEEIVRVRVKGEEEVRKEIAEYLISDD